MLKPVPIARNGARNSVLAAQIDDTWHRVRLVKRMEPGVTELRVQSLETTDVHCVPRERLRLVPEHLLSNDNAHAFACQV